VFFRYLAIWNLLESTQTLGIGLVNFWQVFLQTLTFGYFI